MRRDFTINRETSGLVPAQELQVLEFRINLTLINVDIPTHKCKDLKGYIRETPSWKDLTLKDLATLSTKEAGGDKFEKQMDQYKI